MTWPTGVVAWPIERVTWPTGTVAGDTWMANRPLARSLSLTIELPSTHLMSLLKY